MGLVAIEVRVEQGPPWTAERLASLVGQTYPLEVGGRTHWLQILGTVLDPADPYVAAFTLEAPPADVDAGGPGPVIEVHDLAGRGWELPAVNAAYGAHRSAQRERR